MAGDLIDQSGLATPANGPDPERAPWEQDLLGMVLEVGAKMEPIVSLNFGGQRHHLINGVAGARQVLIERAECYASVPFPLARLAPAITAPGRALLRTRLGAGDGAPAGVPLAEAIEAAVDELITSWQTAACAAAPIDCGTSLKSSLLGLMTRVLFGCSPPTASVSAAARAMAALERYRAYQLPPGTLAADGSAHRQLQDASAVEYAYARDLLVNAKFDGMDPHRPIPRFDDPRGWGAADHLVQMVSRLLMNAYNGAAVALLWMVWRLARHPEVRQRIATEAASVPGGLRYESAGSLVYTRQVVLEALRLHPPAWAIGREVRTDDVIAGAPVARGDIVTIATYLLHRHPAHWPEPDAFRPERFAAGTGRPNPGLADAYLPFGAGPFGCPAGAFATRELQYLVARLAVAFDWTLAADGASVRPWALISLHPSPRVAIKISPRAGGVAPPS